MNRLPLVCGALLLVGCSSSRHLTFPDARPTREARHLPTRWAVGEVFVHPPQQQYPVERELGAMRGELQQRLSATLAAQPTLGQQVDRRARPEVLVDVEVSSSEAERTNGWLGLGLGLETATLGAGAVAGAAVAGPLGSLLGVLVAAPVALVAALTPPSATGAGHFEAKVSLRRAADGAVLGVRHVLAEWEGQASPLAAAHRVEGWCSEGAATLEAAVLDAVVDVLDQAAAAQAPTAAASASR